MKHEDVEINYYKEFQNSFFVGNQELFFYYLNKYPQFKIIFSEEIFKDVCKSLYLDKIVNLLMKALNQKGLAGFYQTFQNFKISHLFLFVLQIPNNLVFEEFMISFSG